MIASTAPRNASIDAEAAKERGIAIMHTGYTSSPTVELTWALILAGARHITSENASLRAGGWQRCIGGDMAGQTLGILGLGSIGSQVAKVGLAFGMQVISWSENLTAQAAAAVGARRVSKEELLQLSDVISIHLVLSRRTRGLIGAAEFALMKPSARLINTSRGPIVVESALIDHLQKFLLELGKGFAFMGRQQRITLDGDHFYVDMVFYNRLARCFVLVDLKVRKLTHADIGQMQMYVNYYARELTAEYENPPIGLLLCALSTHR